LLLEIPNFFDWTSQFKISLYKVIHCKSNFKQQKQRYISHFLFVATTAKKVTFNNRSHLWGFTKSVVQLLRQAELSWVALGAVKHCLKKWKKAFCSRDGNQFILKPERQRVKVLCSSQEILYFFFKEGLRRLLAGFTKRKCKKACSYGSFPKHFWEKYYAGI